MDRAYLLDAKEHLITASHLMLMIVEYDKYIDSGLIEALSEEFGVPDNNPLITKTDILAYLFVLAAVKVYSAVDYIKESEIAVPKKIMKKLKDIWGQMDDDFDFFYELVRRREDIHMDNEEEFMKNVEEDRIALLKIVDELDA